MQRSSLRKYAMLARVYGAQFMDRMLSPHKQQKIAERLRRWAFHLRRHHTARREQEAAADRARERAVAQDMKRAARRVVRRINTRAW